VMGRIQESWLQIKVFLDQGLAEWGIFGVVVLVGLISFGLGRLSALQEARPPISVRNSTQLPAPTPVAPGGLVVAARGGNSYYFPWCGGVEKISTGNRMWFKSEAAAKAAGYVPAKNCKGLGVEQSE
jgi:hypothetical protein